MPISQQNMWRILSLFGRGVRNVRPIQCCSQDYCDDRAENQQEESSAAPAATLKLYSATLTFRGNSKGLAGGTFGILQPTKCASHPIITVACGGIHTQSHGAKEALGSYHIPSCPQWHWDGAQGTVSTSHTPRCPPNHWDVAQGAASTSHTPRCPPWHWDVIQSHNTGKKQWNKEHHEEGKKGEDTWGWGHTCCSQEWKEVLSSSSILQAIGWGSATALTWSLYRGWRDKHPLQGWIRNREGQKSNRTDNTNSSLSVHRKEVEEGRGSKEECWGKHDIFQCFCYDCFLPQYQQTPLQTHNDDEKSYQNQYNFSWSFFSFPYKKVSSPVVSQKLEPSHITDTKVPTDTSELSAPELSVCLQDKQVAKSVSDTQELDKHTFNADLELSEVDEPQACTQNDSSSTGYKTDSGCASDLSQKSSLLPPNRVQEVSQCSQTESYDIGDYVATSGHDTSVSSTTKPEAKVEAKELKNCTSSDREQNASSGKATPFSIDRTTINKFTNSLLEVLEASSDSHLPGVVEEGGSLVDTDPEQAMVYFQAGSMLGDPSSMFNLALCYHMGHGTTKNFKMARELYEAASAAGHGWATYNLAVMVSHGLGGPAHPHQAHTLLQQAGRRGVQEALQALTLLGEQQLITHEGEDLKFSHCHSEPSFAPESKDKWPSWYSTGDLQCLLEEDSWLVTDLATKVDVSEKNKPQFYL